MKQSQKQAILELLRHGQDRRVSCRVFAQAYLYHKLSTRVSELNAQGYEIEYIPSDSDSPLDAQYRLAFDPEVDMMAQSECA